MKILPHLLLLLALFSSQTFAINDDDLLPPEEAFRMSAEMTDAETLRITWTAAEGYYFYKSKFQVDSKTDGLSIGDGSYPAGKVKNDEFFGEMEIYRNSISAEFPLSRAADLNTLALETRSQGCADLGVCYPPQTHTASLELPLLAAATSSADSSLQALAQLGNDLGLGNSDEPLPPEQAFRLSLETEGGELVARWQIAPGYYLYKDKALLALRSYEGVVPEGVKMGAPVFESKSKTKDDEFFGRIEVFYDELVIRVPLEKSGDAAQTVPVEVAYQGCAEMGICYPPIKEYLNANLPKGPLTLAAASSAGDKPQVKAAAQSSSSAPVVRSEQDQLADSLANDNKFITILTFFLLGLALAFTPCVFPMIPILSSIIVGQGESITTRKAFVLSLVYVLAMAITYTFAGVLAGLFGSNLQAAFQDPWVLSTFAVIFAVLSLSMFGFYELQMPNSIQSRLTNISNSQEGGTLAGVALMGLLSALIVGPCVAPPLMGALIYIGQSGDAFLGGSALFALAMGMGAPLLVIGTLGGKVLPRAGTWMDPVKYVFGVLMLAVAVWMLERILPGEITLILWALLLIVPAIYMGALENLGETASGWSKLWKGLGIVMLVYGALLLIGAASGSKDAFQPLDRISAGGGGHGGAQQGGHVTFVTIKSEADLKREVAAAQAAGKSVMLDFYADWCVSCKEMEKYTFSDAGVIQSLSNTVSLQADVTANDDVDKALMKSLDVFGPPSIHFWGSTGEERVNYRVVGYKPAEEFKAHVEKAIR